MSTVPAGGSAYGAFPSTTVAGTTIDTVQRGIAGTVTTPVAGTTTTTTNGLDFRKSRNSRHRLNRTIQTTATVAVVNASVAVATDAINTVRLGDRVPATLVTGKRTGRVRRLTEGAVATLDTLVAGADYTPSLVGVTVNMTRTTGDLLKRGGGCVCLITTDVAGTVTDCTLVATRGGTGYAVDELLTAAPGTIGPGTGFSIRVATVAVA